MRNFHRWVSVAITLPLLIIIVTGIMLQARTFIPWMSPSYKPGSTELNVTFPQILEAARTVPQARIHDWKDVSQIDVRPTTALVRLRSKTGNWEIQIDGDSGEVLSVGQRRVSWIMALHQGANFGNFVRYGIFLPSSLGLFFLLVSGIVLFFRHWRTKWRIRR